MKSRILFSSFVLALVLSGCVVSPVPPARTVYYREPVMVAPPPPRVEYIGPPPVVGQLWIGGFWNWTGHRHEWVPGHWEAPRPGYGWVPHRWDRDGDHWRMQGGHWEERREQREYRDHDHRDHDRRDWR